MNPTILALIGIMLASLAAIPFVAPQFESDYAPTGSLLLNSSNFEVSQGDMSEIPGSEHTSYGPDGFVKEIETPYGKFRFISNYEKIVRELLKPDERVIVTETCDSISWVIQKRDASLNITQTPERIVEKFSMPNGWIKTVKENGAVNETWSGLNFTLINETFISVNRTLWDRVKKIEEMTNGVLGNVTTTTIPNGVHVVINEFELNPAGDDAENEWVEIYNPTSNSVNISGWKIYNKNLDSKIIPNNTIINAGGYYVLNTSGITLTNSGEQLILKSGDAIIDATPIKIDKKDDNNCWARVPNGQDTNSDTDWKFQVCTKKAWNG